MSRTQIPNEAYAPTGAWYVAALSSELSVGGIVARTVLDHPVALFRADSGQVFALEDRCPHRFAPLSSGVVKGDSVQCPYHGLEFDGTGACSRNPYGPVLRAATIRAYPVEERHRALWIWMGEQGQANPALIPDFGFLAEAPDTAFSAGYMHVAANYELIVDNIMDLTHTDYLHAGSIAGTGMVHKVKPFTSEFPDRIEVCWFAPDVPLSPFHSQIYSSLERADQLVRIEWYLPGIMKLTANFMPCGRPEEEAFSNTNAHFITPETKTSAHYFFAATRNYSREDIKLNAFIAESREKAFATEDKPIIELVQNRMGSGDFWKLKPLLLGVDEAAVRVRRRLEKATREEEAHATPRGSGF
jgi:phenylpropionate dioxygenase-like ring-hydroxylating dioxygenase large terminal subunit